MVEGEPVHDGLAVTFPRGPFQSAIADRSHDRDDHEEDRYRRSVAAKDFERGESGCLASGRFLFSILIDLRRS
jgi:hypothetical protein